MKEGIKRLKFIKKISFNFHGFLTILKSEISNSNRCSQIADEGMSDLKRGIKNLTTLKDFSINLAGYLSKIAFLTNIDVTISLILALMKFSRASTNLIH